MKRLNLSALILFCLIPTAGCYQGESPPITINLPETKKEDENENQPRRVYYNEFQAGSRTFSMYADAQVNITPDEVLIDLGIANDSLDIDIATSKNDEVLEKLLGLLDELQIPRSSATTNYLMVEPRSTWEVINRRNTPVFLGYFVRRNVTIVLRDVTKFDSLLKGAIKLGINNVHNIEFRTTQLRKLRDEARTMALVAVRDKAKLFTEALGCTLGDVVSIREDSYRFNSPYFSWDPWNNNSGFYSSSGGSGSRGMPSQNSGTYVSSSTPPDSSTTLAPGLFSVSVGVTVSFLFRNAGSEEEISPATD
ncbi:MAG: SIMPL domain-containing protein [Planctomycetes bacterium]|nr:SIMPL domain-containing protein [Planctomycetota bacterium]